MNQHSDDDVRFFGVELRLIRIGSSPPAAEFRVESRPNDWQKVGGGTVRRKHQRFKLRTDGKRYRYYLVWITKLPPNQERVEISEVSLFRKTPT